MTKFLSSENAVSEVVDFVTITGILVLSIGLVVTAGYSIMKNAQETKHIENTRQSFIVLAENVNKVVLGQAPSQSIELKLYEGTLSITGGSTIKINVTAFNSTSSENEETTAVDQSMNSIESTVGDTVTAYEGTGVWVRYPGSNTLSVYKPLIASKGNVLIIPVVYLNGQSSVGGSGVSSIRVKGEPGVIFYSNVSSITMTINSSYSDGWMDYFEDITPWDCTSEDISLTCTASLTNEDVYIVNTGLDTWIT